MKSGVAVNCDEPAAQTWCVCVCVAVRVPASVPVVVRGGRGRVQEPAAEPGQ